MLRLKHHSTRIRDVDVAKGREELSGEFWDLVLKENEEDRMDRESDKRGSTAKTRKGKDHIGHHDQEERKILSREYRRNGKKLEGLTEKG